MFGDTKRGCFDNDKLLVQVDKAIDVFESKYSNAQALFLFDNVLSHKKYSDNTLNGGKMNVWPDGKQLVICSTVFSGDVQEMFFFPNEQPKVMAFVLEERGVDSACIYGVHSKSESRKAAIGHPEQRELELKWKWKMRGELKVKVE